MKRIDIKRFAGTDFSWGSYELKNIKRNGNGELTQVTVEASLNTGGKSIDVIYEVDGNGNITWATDSWTMTPVTETNTVILTKTYTSDTSEIKGIQVKNWSNDLEADLYFYFTVIDSNKTTYITKTSATAVLKGNVVNNLSTYDWNNAPSIGAVRNYLESSAVLHQSDIENIVSQAVSAALLAGHPVGSIEVNVSGDNPGTYLGGTWESFGTGKTLVGIDASQTEFNTIEKTGGSKTHSHNYGLKAGGYYCDTVLTESAQDGVFTWDSNNNRTLMTLNSSVGSQSVSVNGGNATSSKSANMAHYQAIANTSYTSNLQPYITVYFWKRIS